MILTEPGLLEERCHFCGFAITPLEVSLIIHGRYVDFETHMEGESAFTFCRECATRIKEYSSEDQSACINRRHRTERDC